MAKTYHIDYDHIAGTMSIKTDNIFEFSQKLDKAIEDEFVNNESIKIWTEEKK